MSERIIYVDNQWLSQLMMYMEPQERFTADDGGVVMHTYGGRLRFVSESFRPELPEDTRTEEEKDREADRYE